MGNEKYVINEINVPQIWGQQVKKVKGGNQHDTTTIYEQIGEVFGPYSTGAEAARALGIKSSSKVKSVLNKIKPTIESYIFWYEGSKTITFRIPNVKYAKGNDLLMSVRKLTLEVIENNMNITGFEIVSVGDIDGAETKIIVNCCNIDCEKTVKKGYGEFISHESAPYCKECSGIIKSINSPKIKGKELLADVRPDLKQYYLPEHNDNIPFKSWTKGSNEKIRLQCNLCSHIESDNEMTTIYHYVNKNSKGEYHSNFNCSYCNCLAIKFPEIASQWDYDKNEKTPWDYSYANSYRAHWKCQFDHGWHVKINDRTHGESNCPQCNLINSDSGIGKLMKQVIKDLATTHKVREETLVEGSRFRNDCVIIGSSGKRVIFEMQGDYWHYSENSIRKNEATGVQCPRDILKFAQNRKNGDLIILLNEYDFSNNGTVPSYEMMKRAILQSLRFLAQRKFIVNSDINYNKLKNNFSLKHGKSYYGYHYNLTVSKNEQIADDISENKMKLVRFQNDWQIF